MTSSTATRKIDIIMSEEDVQARLNDLAARLKPRLTGEWTSVAILLGAMPFAVDLMKALARLDIHPIMDAIWLESYHDGRESSGRVGIKADISREIKGRGVLLLDDVFDTGRTLDFARKHMLAKGAREVVSCAMAIKPVERASDTQLDYYAFEAPARFLVGYGMDDAGLYRGIPFIGALD